MQGQAARGDFSSVEYWTITRLEGIEGVVFHTLGPKRPYRRWRQHNGVTILVDPTTYQPFGWVEFEGDMADPVIILPLTGSLTAIYPPT